MTKSVSGTCHVLAERCTYERQSAAVQRGESAGLGGAKARTHKTLTQHGDEGARTPDLRLAKPLIPSAKACERKPLTRAPGGSVPVCVPDACHDLARTLLTLDAKDRDQLARELLVLAPDSDDPGLGIDMAKRLLESLPKTGEKVLRVRKSS